MESEAWEKAKELANHYGVEIDENLVQDELDTYREWLHQKSRCPKCGLTRFQTPDSQYHCPSCETFKNDKK
jgi:rubrerythrin